MDKVRSTSSLLASISGVLLFLSLAHWIDLNGFSNWSPFLILLGIAMIFWPHPFVKLIPFKWIGVSVIKTASHILIFIGLKVYLDQYIETSWIIYLIIGIILLNNHLAIAKKLFPKG